MKSSPAGRSVGFELFMIALCFVLVGIIEKL